MYYPLHTHTALGSIGDATLKIEEYVQRAVDLGLDKIAITDHGSLSAVFTFIEECVKKDIRPIVGMEAYEVPDANVKDARKYNHLILLAKTEEGFHNLLKIHNDAQTRGFYYKPRTDIRALERWGTGILATSACVAGSIPQAILTGDIQTAETLAKNYKAIFDNFFFEIQPGTFSDQLLVNDALVSLSQTLDISLVATNDIHYLRPEDYRVHDYHVKLSRKKDKEDFSDALVYADTCYWFMSESDIFSAFQRTDILTDEVIRGAINNTAIIAEACSSVTDFSVRMPQTGFKNEQQELFQRCYQKLNDIIQDKTLPQVYVDRLEYELSVISQKGFCGYFLIVQDFIQWARTHGISIGPGRGSAAGSLVTYLLGISAADPIKHGLLFERFMDPQREAIPDIDIDTATTGRDILLQHLLDTYGKNNCAQISAIHIRKAKAAIKDAARILNLPVDLANDITKLIPTVAYDDDGNKETDLDIQTSLDMVSELRTYQAGYPELFKLAEGLEGLPSAMSTHAAGIVISPDPLQPTLPLIKAKEREDILVTSLSLEDAEKQLVKFDILALNTLDILSKTEKETGIRFDYENDTYDDPKIWEVINSKYTAGVFQISSPTYKQRMWRLRPQNIKELANCLALVRGPCISSKTDEEYMLIREGKQSVKKIHPIYDKVTASTNGILIYQEQVMNLAVGFGMDISTGYRIVKAAAKKKQDELAAYHDQFIELATLRNCSLKTAEKIFDLIEKSSQYSFNYSHAVSYSLLVYSSAWLKYYYTLPFMKNLLTDKYVNNKTKEYAAIVKDALEIGIQFLPPDINKSSWEFTLEDGKIRVGLCAIKGLGEKAAKHFLERKREDIRSLDQLLEIVDKKSFNKTKVLTSIFAGLFDSLEIPRQDLYKQYCQQYLETQPEEEIKISKDVVIKTNARAVKGLQTKLLGAVYF